jgi:hypothetical protein
MVASHIGFDVKAEFLELPVKIVDSRIEVGIDASGQYFRKLIQAISGREVLN